MRGWASLAEHIQSIQDPNLEPVVLGVSASEIEATHEAETVH